MKKKGEKIKEPYAPDDTPKPPQIIDPNTGRQRENPVEDKGRTKSKPESKEAKKGERAHLRSEESEIDDDTTI